MIQHCGPGVPAPCGCTWETGSWEVCTEGRKPHSEHIQSHPSCEACVKAGVSPPAEAVILLRGEPGQVVVDLVNLAVGMVFLKHELAERHGPSIDVLVASTERIRAKYPPGVLYHAVKGLVSMAHDPASAERMLELMQMMS